MHPKLLPSLAMLVSVVGLGSGFAGPAHAEAPPITEITTASLTLPTPAIKTGEAAPDALLSAATSVVTTRLKQEGKNAGKSSTSIAELLESTILPLFDFRHMTQLAMARNWKLATPEQQSALVGEFKTLLVRTYYAALVNYRDEVIEYKPLTLASGETDVTVKSTVKKPGVERMSIDYDMEKMPEGWKVYDIRIAGISLTTTYRSSFAEIIREGGIDELIRFLAAKNRHADAGISADDSEARGILFLYGVAPNILRGHQ